jgi:hypothetical protein
MSSEASNYANLLQHYNSAAWNLLQKIQQDRGVHMSELSNVYMEAVRSGLPDGFLSMVEHMIADRSTYNSRKTILDGSEMSKHAMKVSSALGPHSDVLTGGASGLAGGGHHNGKTVKAMDYAAKRYNALVYNLNKKLAHDRSIHFSELRNVHREATRLAGGGDFAEMLSTMVGNRATFNARKTAFDAAQWAELETAATDMGCGHVLHAGATHHQKKA